MTWTVSASGTLTADGSEDVLTTDTTNGTYVLVVDLSNLLAGSSGVAAQVVELRCYSICLAAGASVLMWKGTYQGGNVYTVLVESPFVASDISCKVTLKQTVQGTSYSAFPWKLLRQ